MHWNEKPKVTFYSGLESPLICWHAHCVYVIRHILSSMSRSVQNVKWDLPLYFVLQIGFHTVNRCSIQFHLSCTNAVIRGRGCSRMQFGFIVVVPPFMFEVICICIQSLQTRSVSLMRSLMRLSPGPAARAKASDGLWNLLFPFAAWGVFHYCTVQTLTEFSIIMSSAAVP